MESLVMCHELQGAQVGLLPLPNEILVCFVSLGQLLA